MAMHVFDRQEMGVLDDFEAFRKLNFAYLYHCAKCNRSFDSKEKLEACKFCSGELKELWSNPKAKRIEKTFRYYCPSCEKNFVTHESPLACEMCGSKFVHVYEWERLGRDVFRTRLRRFLRGIKNLDFQLPKVPKPQPQSQQEKRKFSLPLQLRNIKLPRIKFSKNEEELPTK